MPTRSPAEAAARRFFSALSKGKWPDAAKECADPFFIFGKSVPVSALASGAGPAFEGPVLDVRELPPAGTSALKGAVQRKLFGRTLAPADQVLFVTVRLPGDTKKDDRATYGVIADLKRPGDPKLFALFDPSSFKALAEALAPAKAPRVDKKRKR